MKNTKRNERSLIKNSQDLVGEFVFRLQITSNYAHLNKIYVYKGQKVTTSDVIGGQGQTGWATGVHLHFQVNVYGIPVNPRVFLDNKDTEIIL